MTGRLRIRTIQPSEHGAVADLTVRAYRTIHDDLGDYEAILRRVGHRATHADVFVAEIDGRLVGTVTFVAAPGDYAEGDDPDAAWIRMLAVDPAFARQGIGQALTRACIERAHASGRRRICLNTGDRHVVAKHLYERFGFARRPDLDEEVEPGFWLRTYELELDRAADC
jgi:predicted N-acetyltransferase YhbS